jgi:hypothetical protein
MNTNELTELLSYEPSAELKRMILADCRATGKCIEEIADKYAMPPQFFLGHGNTFEYNGETMTSEQFKQRFPFRRFVTIRCRDNNETKQINN